MDKPERTKFDIAMEMGVPSGLSPDTTIILPDGTVHGQLYPEQPDTNDLLTALSITQS